MAAGKLKKPLEPADKSPHGWACWWFAMGAGEAGTVERLVAGCGLDRPAAEACYEEMREKLTAEIENLREHYVDWAAVFFRQIKGNPAADWASRQRAELELEDLLDVLGQAQEPGGLAAADVLEAFYFHHLLLAADGPTPQQRLRSHKRLSRLLGQTPRGRRTSNSGGFPRREGEAPAAMEGRTRQTSLAMETPTPLAGSAGTSPSQDDQQHAAAEREDSQPAQNDASREPADDPRPYPECDLDAATQRRLLEQLTRDADEWEVEFERLTSEEGLSPQAACELLEEREAARSPLDLAAIAAGFDLPPATSGASPALHARAPPV